VGGIPDQIKDANLPPGGGQERARVERLARMHPLVAELLGGDHLSRLADRPAMAQVTEDNHRHQEGP